MNTEFGNHKIRKLILSTFYYQFSILHHLQRYKFVFDMKIRITTFLFLSFFYVSCAFAQESAPTQQPPKKDVILSTSLTGNAYYGDMNYNPSLFQTGSNPYFSLNPGVNLSIYTDHPRFLRPAFSGGYGRIVGQNSTFQPTYYTNSLGEPELAQPTRYVRTDYVYGDVGLRFTPIRKIAQFDPYLYAGVGGFFFRPVKLSSNGEPLVQGGLKSNSYSAVAVSFPLSAGMDINLGRKVSLNVGATMRLPMTDFIDNTGTNYGGAYNVQDGNDKIFAMNVGANFRIFDSEKLPKIFRFPELFFSEQKKSEPEDTLILASALDISEHPEFLAPKVWQSHDPAAKKMKSLMGELVMTSDCDSLSRKYEERILNLTNENLQLRGEYSKLAQETNKLREENQNYALKEKVANETLSQLSANKGGDKGYSGVAANRTVDSLMNIVNKLKAQSVEGMAQTHENSTEKDSLMRVIAEKEGMIADLEAKAKSIPATETTPAPTPIRKAGVAEEDTDLIASYEQKLDSLKGEMSRLQRKYKEASGDAAIATGKSEALKERLKATEAQKVMMTNSSSSNSLDELAYKKQLDSLANENERTYAEVSRLRTENDAMKKNKYAQIAPDTDCRERVDSLNLILDEKKSEYATLLKQYNNVVAEMRNSKPVSQDGIQTIQKQVADIMAKVAQLQQERDEARGENERLVEENSKLKKDQQVLITQNTNQAILIMVQRAQERVDSMNAYFSALQKNIDGYERKINDLRAQNDSLETELRQLNQMVNGEKSIDNIKVATLSEQLKEANNKIADLDAKLAQSRVSGVAPNNFEEDIKDLQEKLAQANDRAQELEDKNNGLIAENSELRTKAKPSPMSPPTASASQSGDKEKIEELEKEVSILKSSKQALLAQIENLETNVSKLEEEKQVLAQGGGTNPDVAGLTAKIEELQSEVEKLNAEKANKPAIAASDEDLVAKSIKLAAENEEMIAKLSSIELDNKQLAGENDLLRKNARQNSTELENLRPKVETLQAQNAQLEQSLTSAKEETVRLAARTSAPASSNDNSDEFVAQLKDKIASLEKDNSVMKGQIDILSADQGNEKLAQIPILEAENADLREQLKNKPVNVAADVALAQAESENEKLKNENKNLIAEVEGLETKLKAKEIENENLLAINKENKPTSPAEPIAEAQAQISDLKSQLDKKEARIQELEANTNTPTASADLQDKYDQLSINYNRLQAENATLVDKWNLSQEGEKPEVLVMTLREENDKLKAEKDSILSRIKEVVAKSGLTTQKVEELATIYKDNEILKGKVANLEAELADAKAKPTVAANPDEAFQAKIADLETANKTLKQQLEANTDEVSRLMKEKDEWELKANQLAAADSVNKANARVGITPVKDIELEELKTEVASLRIENADLKKQIAEGGNPEAALAGLQEKLTQAEADNERKEKEIADWKSVAEGNNDKGAEIAKLTNDVKVLTDENRSLKDEIAKAQPQVADKSSEVQEQLDALKSAMVDKEEEMSKVRKDNADLIDANRALKEELANAPKVASSDEDKDSQITSLQLAIADKDAEIERLKATPKTTVVDNSEELNKLKNENLRLNEENQYLKEELAGVKVSDPNIPLQSKINELQSVIEQKDKEIADLKTTNPNTNGVASALSEKGDALNSRYNEQEMREKKLNQRENYITLKEEEIHRNEKKYEYLNAKEIELRLSEQRIAGFYNRPENMLLDGAPCQYVTAFSEKEEVMNKIDDYFLGMGYNYRLENGKIVYSNIVIPEISNKPMNIAFYMRIADTGKRTLQGVFRFTNGTYVNEDKFPAETIKAIKLLQKLAQ
jgi:golgin subfamily A member 4